MHGLEINRSYTYRVYDGETQTVSPVEQKVLAYEESDLYQGKAFKINTRLHGHEVTTWMDANGRPLLEMSLGGVIISALESQSTARKCLAQAALNKAETLLDFSLIRSDVPIQNPALVKSMEVVLAGIDPKFKVPDDARQQCQRHDNEFKCRIQPQVPDKQAYDRSKNQGHFEQYLLSSYIIPSNRQRIRQTAQEIVTNAGIIAGLVNISVIGSTASISTVEYEPALVQDIQNELEKWIPSTLHSLHSQTWGDDNGFSHIRATFMGPGITMPVVNGRALLGTWQQIIVIDHDNRPRTRQVYVQVMGE